MIEHCCFVCEKMQTASKEKATGNAPDAMFVHLVVHLQRGMDNSLSCDFDSQWLRSPT